MMDCTRKSAILIIYTGGTIGMKQDLNDMTLKPFDFSQILEEVPEIGKFAFKTDTWSFDPPIDSSDVEPALWQSLCKPFQLFLHLWHVPDGSSCEADFRKA